MHQNYILKIDLLPRFITNPRITRTLSCPANAKFAELHKALQIAFGWANTHLYDFEVLDHNSTMGSESRLALDRTIFKITDLTNDDEFDFNIPGIPPQAPKRDSSKVTLRSILDGTETKGKTIHYQYDFGDGWEHVITCTGRETVTTNFVCLDGEGHGCAEDAGGASGWIRLLEAYDAQTPSKEQKELRHWHETFASNKEPAGLGGDLKFEWDKDVINLLLGNRKRPATAISPSTRSVFFVSFEKEGWFDEMYAQVLRKVRERAALTEVTDSAQALRELSKPQDAYIAVVVTSAAIMEKKYVLVQHKLMRYAAAGGTVVLGFQFASSCTPPKLKTFFQDIWSLEWSSGDYHRADFAVSPNFVGDLIWNRDMTGLEDEYSMKALHLQGTKVQERVYVEHRDSQQSPVDFSRYGNNGGFWDELVM